MRGGPIRQVKIKQCVHLCFFIHGANVLWSGAGSVVCPELRQGSKSCMKQEVAEKKSYKYLGEVDLFNNSSLGQVQSSFSIV